MDEFLYLWPIYGSALQAIQPDPNPGLTASLKAGGNVAVLRSHPASAQQDLVTSLRICAKESYDLLTQTSGAPADAWLVIDVPVPGRVEPRDLLHRMIRRLYYSAVLHGMGEIREFRETVQVLRLAYLQTRGSVSQGRDTESIDRTGVEMGGKLSLKPELSAKLSAGDEVKVVEKLNAEMARLDLFEAEDELTYDLTLLQRLEFFANRHAQVSGVNFASLQRWERIRNWFKDLYAPLQTQHGVRLRSAYVFDATSVVSVLSITQFLSQAAGVANAQSAQIFLTGGPSLSAAIKADRAIGSPVFRDAFDVHEDNDSQLVVSEDQLRLLKTILANPQKTWAPEIVEIANGMVGNLTVGASNSK